MNPDDSYKSRWFGGRDGGPASQLVGNGDAIVGIYGRQGHDIDAIGFVRIDDGE